METPNSTPINNTNSKLINNPSSDFQESPIFNYISNLSPIQPVKAESVAQGFPGLASPPLIFTSPQLNSQTSFFYRKLQSPGSNLEFPQDNGKTKLKEGNMDASVKVGHESCSLLVGSEQKNCHTENLLQASICNLSGGFDEFFPDSGQCAKSSYGRQAGTTPPSVYGGCLEKIDDCNNKNVGLDNSIVQMDKEIAQSKSNISSKLLNNAPRCLISSPECLGVLPRLLTKHKSEISQTGKSFSEASHLERGTLKRCLFDGSQQKNSAVEPHLSNPIASSHITESASMSTGKSASRQVINLSRPVIGTCVSPVTENSHIANSKPLGIGLHLNSVVDPGSMDNASVSQKSFLVKIEGKSSLFVTNNQSHEEANSSVTVKDLARSEDIDQHQACLVPTSDKTIASDALQQLNDAVNARLDACSPSTNNKNKLSSELDEYNKSGHVVLQPKKKRKKASSSVNDETSKLCNCKKTKCLKLYCDCFAAGFYCGESCSCQSCFNRAEYEDTVVEAKQQIESRNPLAFAPKIVQPVAESPAINEEVGNLSTPSSARHKRGCNCKKSMCQKKYCECYQANVGCSDGCRCEGCKNIYGIREDYVARELMIKRTSLEMSEKTMVNNDLVSSRVHSSPKLTPITPALQCLDRKFVLRAVPSYPLLKPCSIDSRSDNKDQSSN